jgi:hypothetical protein
MLQLHALAYNLAKFLRTLVLPQEIERWLLTSLREKKRVEIGTKGIAHAHSMSTGRCALIPARRVGLRLPYTIFPEFSSARSNSGFVGSYGGRTPPKSGHLGNVG